MEVTLEVDNHEIIDSGVVILSADKTLKFSFKESNLHFIFEFLNDNDTAEPRFVSSINKDENYLLTKLYNFNSQGQGYGDLIKMAKINNRQLSIKFRVDSIGEETPDKIFHYTWYFDKNEIKL